MTDSIEAARRARDRVSTEQVAIRSIEAGNDIVLTTGQGSWIRVYRALLGKAQASKAFRARVRDVGRTRAGAPADAEVGHLSSLRGG